MLFAVGRASGYVQKCSIERWKNEIDTICGIELMNIYWFYAHTK